MEEEVDTNPKSNEDNAVNSIQIMEEEILLSKQHYGCFNFNPKWLQILNHRLWLAFVIAIFQLLYVFISAGYDSSTISTLEKGFGLTSTDISGIGVPYSISQCVVGMLISHKASASHKGKWLGWTGIITAIGCFIYALPHFVIPAYATLTSYDRYNSNQTDLCVAHNETNPNLQSLENTNKGLYIFIFSLGQFILGIGTSILGSVGWSYLDESVSPTAAPIYNGINLCISGLGAGVGFALGGIILDLYVYWPSNPPDPKLTPDNPNWVGAWWLGFVASAIVTLGASILMFGFPRHLPNYELYKKQREEKAVGKSKVDNNYGQSMKEILPAMKELLCNLPFVYTVLGIVGHLMVLSAIGRFLPKYVEVQYGVATATANLYAGAMLIAGMLLGLIVIGGVTKKVEMNVLRMTKYTWIISAVGVLTAVIFAITRCPSTAMAGVNVPYSNYTKGIAFNQKIQNLTSACNMNCNCNDDNFKPVCDEGSGLTYFSPCHAGCTFHNNSISLAETYKKCSCLNYGAPFRNQDVSQGVILNYCPKDCNGFVPFLILAVVFAVIAYCTLIPSMQIIFRCVPESQRSLALAMRRTIVLVLGTTPGPIIMGVFIDSACTLWSMEGGERKFCWIYDSEALAFAMTGMLLVMKIISTLFSFLAYYYLKRDIEKFDCSKQLDPENKDAAGIDNAFYSESPLENETEFSSNESASPKRNKMVMAI